MHVLRGHIRGCSEPVELPEAGHFVQEAGAVLVEAALHRFSRGAEQLILADLGP